MKTVKLRPIEIEHFLDDDLEYEPHQKTKIKKVKQEEYLTKEQDSKNAKISQKRVGHQRNIDLY
jgi:predicted type IV restriction endonuclease